MVHLVTSDNRRLYGEEIAWMHKDRKRVFVDRMKWNVPVVDGLFEIDQFDTDDAIYLMALDPATRRHLGSVRLLPSTKPHILGSLFPELCEDEDVPTGEDVWEITRLCTMPGLKKGEPARIRQYLATALVEFGLLYGINRYTCVAEMSWLSQILSMGWECEPLGLPMQVDGEMISALSIMISPSTLKVFRMKNGSRSPVLQIERPAMPAIAA